MLLKVWLLSLDLQLHLMHFMRFIPLKWIDTEVSIFWVEHAGLGLKSCLQGAVLLWKLTYLPVHCSLFPPPWAIIHSLFSRSSPDCLRLLQRRYENKTRKQSKPHQICCKKKSQPIKQGVRHRAYTVSSRKILLCLCCSFWYEALCNPGVSVSKGADLLTCFTSIILVIFASLIFQACTPTDCRN